MSGNITGLGVVISGIIKRRITYFVCHFLYDYFFSGAGRLFLGGNCRFFPFAVSLEEGHHNRAFLEFCFAFLLPTSLLLTCFCSFSDCLSYAFPLFLPSSASIPFNLFSGGTPFVNYHVSTSAGGGVGFSRISYSSLFLYVRLLYILFFSVYYWTITGLSFRFVVYIVGK